MADDSIISYGDLIGDDGTFEELSKQIKQIESELLDMAKTTKKAFQSLKPSDLEGLDKLEKKVKEIEVAEKNLVKTKKLANKARKKTIDLTNEELIQREKEKIQQRERVQRAKQLAIIRKEEKDTITSLRAQLSLVTLDWKKFTAEELKNTKEGQKLVKNKKRLTEQLKKLEKQTGDNRRNVGNYNSALKGLRKTFIRLFVGRTIIEGIARLGGALVNIVKDGAETNDKFAALVQTFGEAKQFFVGLATTFLNFISGPLSKLVNTFLFVADAISKASSEGTFLGSVFSTIGSIFNKVIDTITLLPAVFGGVVSAAKDFGTTLVNSFKRISLQLQIVFAQINKSNPFTKKTTAEINAQIDAIRARQSALASQSLGVSEAFKKGYNAVLDAQKEFNKREVKIVETEEQIAKRKEAQVKAQAKLNELLQKQKELLKDVSKSEAARLESIKKLQEKITKIETENIEDRQQRALALEDLRFKAEQQQQENNFLLLIQQIEKQEQQIIDLFGENSKEVIDFRNKAAKDLLTIEAANQTLSEDQLQKSEDRKLEIVKQRFKKINEIEALNEEKLAAQRKKQVDDQLKQIGTSSDELNANIKSITDEENRIREEARKNNLEKTKKDNKELLNNISETAKKVSGVINDIFQKQVDLSAKSVDEQEANLSRARDRAAKGLETNLAFEEQELAKRQSENLKRQKEAKQAAKFLTLLNLVSSYAASGDKNALARGLVDFSILTALEASFGGLYEGTEDTGTVANPLDAKGGRLYTLHDNERVVPKFLNDQLNGMSNKDMVYNALLGSQIGDYYNPQSPITQDYYKAQKEAFKRDIKTTKAGNSEMVSELKAIKTQLAKQPNYTAQIVKVQEDTHAFILREVKQGMTKVYKKMLRAKK